MEPAQNCEICYKIICKNCKWVASDEEVLKIGKGELKNCPDCGWAPEE